MDWKEDTKQIWNEWLKPLYDHADCSKDCNYRYQYEQDKKAFIIEIQQLLNQRDEEIIGKLEGLKELRHYQHPPYLRNNEQKRIWEKARLNVLDKAISTIKENK